MDLITLIIYIAGIIASAKAGIYFARAVNRPIVNLIVACLCVLGAIAGMILGDAPNAGKGMIALLLWVGFFGGGIAAVEKERAMKQGSGDSQD